MNSFENFKFLVGKMVHILKMRILGCDTAPPPLCQEEASSEDSVEMWVVHHTAPPPLHLVTPPPPSACLVTPPPPPLTRVEEVSSDESPSDSSGYNDECPHVKKVSSYELLLYFNYLVQLLNVHIHFQIQKLEKKLVVDEKELQQVRKDNQAVARYINAVNICWTYVILCRLNNKT
jgi:hypothetical protein